MEHSLRLPTAVRPWRTAACVAAAVAVVELVLLVFAGVALLAKPLSHHARKVAVASVRPKPKPRKPPQTGPPSLARRQTTVAVLNGNGRTGAAATEAERVHARGYRIGRVGNAPQMTYSHSVVMYRRAYRPEALRLARDLRIAIVAPLDGLRRRDLRRAQLAVVVGE